MSNNYYDMTGLLKLKQITPIIKALFGSHDVKHEANTDAGVTAYIAETSEDITPNWSAICEALTPIAEALGIPIDGDGESEDDNNKLIQSLLSHYKNEDGKSYDDGNGPQLEDLYDLAMAMDDGHGLEAIKIEGCWHGDKARLFEFGGHALYIGKQYEYGMGSERLANFAEVMDQLLTENALVNAGSVLASHVLDLVSGIKDDDKRALLIQSLSEALAPADAEDETPGMAPR